MDKIQIFPLQQLYVLSFCSSKHLTVLGEASQFLCFINEH